MVISFGHDNILNKWNLRVMCCSLAHHFSIASFHVLGQNMDTIQSSQGMTATHDYPGSREQDRKQPATACLQGPTPSDLLPPAKCNLEVSTVSK